MFNSSHPVLNNNQVGPKDSICADPNPLKCDLGSNQKYTSEDRKMGKPMPLSAVVEQFGSVNSVARDDWEDSMNSENDNSIETVRREMMESGDFDGSSAKVRAFKALRRRLLTTLRKSQFTVLEYRKVMVPPKLLDRICMEISKMSESEPYGIKGALVNVRVEQANTKLKENERTLDLGKLESMGYVAETFVLNVTLKEDTARWNTMWSVLGRLVGKNKEVYMSQEYTIEKQKLYRSNSS